MSKIKCPSCKASELEVGRNSLGPGVTVRCGNCGYIDAVTED